MAGQNENELGIKPVPRLLLKLAIPAVTAQIINALYNIVDRMYIARIPGEGDMALTGLGVAFPIIMIISAFAALIGMGGAPLASIRMGANKKEEAEEILGNCVTLLLIVSVLVTTFFLVFKQDMLTLFGASSQSLPYADQYFTIYACGTIAVQLALGLNSFISAQGFAKQAMLTVLIGAVLNIVLDPALIFGFHMGVQGAAIATVFSQAVSSVWVVRFLLGRKTDLKIKRDKLRLKRGHVLAILALGVSPFIMQSTESLVQIVFNTNLQRLGGDNYVAAMTIMLSIMQVGSMLLLGFTQGAQPIIGFNYGAKDYKRTKTAVKYCLLYCSIVSITIFLGVILFPGLIARAFTDSPAIIDLAAKLLPIFFLGFFLMAAQITFQNTFIALGKAKLSMFLALLRKIILLIPLVYLLPAVWGPDPVHVVWAEPIADIIACLTTTIAFFIVARRTLKEG